MPPTKGGKRPPKGGKGSGKGSGKGKRGAGGSGKAQPQKSGSVTGKRSAVKRKHAKKKARWSIYIHRTLKGLHKELKISSRAMTIMGSFVEDMFEKINTDAVNIAKMANKKTVSAREVQTSARLLLPKELAKHAMSEGTKAVSKFYTAKKHREQASAA